MDTTTGLILGVCVTLIGGVILLFIEYSPYFQKKKHGGDLQKKSDEESPLWKDAINRAVQDFGINHADSTVEIYKWNVINDKAQVRIYIRKKVAAGRRPERPLPSNFRTLTVDRKGDILEIKSH